MQVFLIKTDGPDRINSIKLIIDLYYNEYGILKARIRIKG